MPVAIKIAGPVPQAAALCFRPLARSRAQILLVTSRSGEWAIPKGRIDPGFTEPEAAANEAREEAGVRGQIVREAVGEFEYLKTGGWAGRVGTRCRVRVFPMLVEELSENWLESEFRERQWVAAELAAGMVAQPGLARVLRAFPAWLKSVRR